MGKRWRKMMSPTYSLKFKNIILFLNRGLFFFQMVISATLFRRCPTLWKSTLKMTKLFQRCLTLFNSTLKNTALFQRCSTLQISMLTYTTLFQHWFDVVRRRNVISTQKQRGTDVEMFAGFCGDGFHGGGAKPCLRVWKNVVVVLYDLISKKQLHFSLVLFLLLSFLS